MRLPTLCNLTISAALIWSSACLADWNAPDTNLLKNPGFEAGGDMPSEWNKGATTRFKRDCTTARSGNASLLWENDDPNSYQLLGQQVRLTPGRRYEISAWIKTDKLEGVRESGATICLEYKDASGNHIKGGQYPGGQKGTRDWWRLVAYSGPVPQQAAEGSFVCYVKRNNKSKKTFTGRAWWDDVCIRPLSLVTMMLQPSSKGIVKDSSPSLEFEFECWPGDFGLTFQQAAIEVRIVDKAGKTVLSQDYDITDRTTPASLDVRKLGAGVYTVVSIMKAKAANTELWRWEHQITRVTHGAATPKVYLDEHGRLIRNGKPMFPLGVYVRKAPVNQLANTPFNCFMSYDILTRKQMDLAHEVNLGVIYAINAYFHAMSNVRGDVQCVDDEVAAMLEQVEKHKNHPALIAWYVNDERGPDFLRELLAHYHALNQADGDHPAWTVHNVPSEMSMLINTTDVIGPDPYPVGLPGSHISNVSSKVIETRKQVRNARPMWVVPQIMDWANYKSVPSQPPSVEEMRCMSWQAITEGARGLIYYSLHDLFKNGNEDGEKRWADVKQMAGEVAQYTDILLSIEQCPELKVTAGAWLHWTSRRVGNTLYIFAVSDGSGSGDVAFNLNAACTRIVWQALGDSQAHDIEPDASSWKDTVENMQVKVYTITLR